jgi:hypothetical protein
MSRHIGQVVLETPKIAKSVACSKTELADRTDRFFAQFTAVRSWRARRRRNQMPTGDLEKHYSRISNVAEALMLWHTNRDFVTSAGEPKRLPISGRCSLTSLSSRVTGRTNEAKLLVRDLADLASPGKKGSHYIPSRRSAIQTSSSGANLAYGTLAICRLIETITSNLSGRSPPLFERQVSNIRIHPNDVPMFLRFVQEQGQYLIDSIDDWLLRRSSSERDAISVGIGAFAWIDKDQTKSKVA